MFRSTVISLLGFFSIVSNASAQTCVGNPVAVQILGSGGPAINPERASAGLSAVGGCIGQATVRHRWRQLHPLRSNSGEACRSRNGRHQPFASRSHLRPRCSDVGKQSLAR